MIINLRGTYGSGKSTIVNRIMDLYPNRFPIQVEKRRQPIGYKLFNDNGKTKLFVPGHYEIACGGCDTIKAVDQVFELVGEHSKHSDVLFEGVMVTDDVTKTVRFIRDHPDFLVIALTTSMEDCVIGVNERRKAEGKPADYVLNRTTPQLAKKLAKGIWRHGSLIGQLKDAGVKVIRADRETAFQICREKLGI